MISLNEALALDGCTAYNTTMETVVIDTCVVVSGIRSRHGASWVLLDRWGEAFTPVLSVPLALEYEAMLMEPRLGLGLTLADVSTLLDYWCGASRLVDVHFRSRPTLADPSDEMVLEACLAGQAQTIVTFNTADFAGADGWGVECITPGEFLRRIEV